MDKLLLSQLIRTAKKLQQSSKPVKAGKQEVNFLLTFICGNSFGVILVIVSIGLFLMLVLKLAL